VNRRRVAAICAGAALAILVAGLLLPERLVIPVAGATRADWNARTFWFRPWGRSGVHRGIDIFARQGTPVVAASSGVVLYAGTLRDGGNVVAILGPTWRVHYYAHLRSSSVTGGQFVGQGAEIGTVGATGNAVGKPSHLHYAIITQLPYVWRYRLERFGFDRMWYLNPHELLGAGTLGN
jgi:murein DD-endopeptidase MepM/ murein hydrolase activator NlpD